MGSVPRKRKKKKRVLAAMLSSQGGGNATSPDNWPGRGLERERGVAANSHSTENVEMAARSS